jgi:hypothetical protein
VLKLTRKRDLEEEEDQEYHKALSRALVFLGSSDGAPPPAEPLGDSQASDVQE